MKFKNFNLEDVLGRDETEEAKVYVGKLGYFANDLDDLDHAITYIPEQTHELVTIKQTGTDNKYVDRLRAFKYFLPLDKVKKTEQTEKHRSPENRNTFDLWIANKVKVRVVTTALDYDNTLFSILGVIEKCEKQGILLKDQNDKEQFICFPNILEVQYLGTDDWSEYEEPDIAEILNRPW